MCILPQNTFVSEGQPGLLAEITALRSSGPVAGLKSRTRREGWRWEERKWKGMEGKEGRGVNPHHKILQMSLGDNLGDTFGIVSRRIQSFVLSQNDAHVRNKIIKENQRVAHKNYGCLENNHYLGVFRHINCNHAQNCGQAAH